MSSDPTQTAERGQQAVLETDVPLSQSLIWRVQRDFYIQRGLKAWTEDRVPEYLTNNPFIAEIYAKIIFNFLQDCTDAADENSRPVSSDNPLRILELGAGHGKFSYLFLKEITQLLRDNAIPSDAVRYYMTDCSPDLIQTWRANRYLARFVERGILSFEFFQAGDEVAQFQPQAIGGPLVVIANYVFDSLPQDAFLVKDGKLSEFVVTTSRGDNASEALSTLQRSYRTIEVSANRYPDQSWNEILNHYRSRLSDATVFFPVQALKTAQQLASVSDGRMLLLAADKGFAYEEDLLYSQGPPAIEFHGASCFSQMVNFDAIGKYFHSLGGQALLPDKHIPSVSICAFLRGETGDDFPKARAAYRESQEAFGPDDLFTLFAWLNAHMEEMTVPQILAALRLTRWDPVTLLRLFPVLVKQLRSVVTEREGLRSALTRTWANHYPLNANENILAFQCGVILSEMGFYEEALSMFERSRRIVGPSAATSYNQALCAAGLKRNSEALAFVTEACKLDAAFEPARQLRKKLEDESGLADPRVPITR